MVRVFPNARLWAAGDSLTAVTTISHDIPPNSICRQSIFRDIKELIVRRGWCPSHILREGNPLADCSVKQAMISDGRRIWVSEFLAKLLNLCCINELAIIFRELNK